MRSCHRASNHIISNSAKKEKVLQVFFPVRCSHNDSMQQINTAAYWSGPISELACLASLSNSYVILPFLSRGGKSFPPQLTRSFRYTYCVRWRMVIIKPNENLKLFLPHSLCGCSFSVVEEHMWYKVMKAVKFLFTPISRATSLASRLRSWGLSLNLSCRNCSVYTDNSMFAFSARGLTDDSHGLPSDDKFPNF